MLRYMWVLELLLLFSSSYFFIFAFPLCSIALGGLLRVTSDRLKLTSGVLRRGGRMLDVFYDV